MGSVLAAANQKIFDRDAEIEKLETKLAAAPTEKPEPQQKSVTARELPDVDDLLNRLRAKMKADRKKSTAGRADIEALVEILKES